PDRVLCAGGERLHLGPAHASSIDAAAYALLIDAVGATAWVAGRALDLRRKPQLLELLLLLAERPLEVVPAEAIYARLWGPGFHPLRHRARVTMAVTRLRRLVGPVVGTVASEGYRLVCRGPLGTIVSAAAGR
ncbi:MAG TPA: winged helix-turn-helix domain-containing protein, partial [Polyangia bacterium]